MQHFWSKRHWDFLPPASQRGNKTLTSPPVFQDNFSNLFNSEEKCLGKFMSWTYLKSSEFCNISPQKCLKSQFSGTLDFKIFQWGCMLPDPLDGSHAFGVHFAPKNEGLATLATSPFWWVYQTVVMMVIPPIPKFDRTHSCCNRISFSN
jgi:hypothetical protein